MTVMTMQKFFRSSAIIFVAGTFLAGCGASVPEATDEEIIALVGEARGSFSRDDGTPPVIIKRTVECAEMLSGLKDEVTKDMPAEMLGMIKTECRQKFDEAVKDSARNTKGFKLEHFENKDFAKRIIAAAEKSEELYKAYEVKRKEEEKAQRWAEKEQELATARAEFEQSLEGYEAVVDEVVAVCAEMKDARETLQNRRRRDYWVDSEILKLCATPKEDILKIVDEDRAKWAAVEVVEGSWGPKFDKPDVNGSRIGMNWVGSTESLKYMQGKVQSVLDDFKQSLEQ